MRQPHQIFNRDFDRALKKTVGTAVNADPVLKKKYWQLLKPRLWLYGSLGSLLLLCVGGMICLASQIPAREAEFSMAELAGFNLAGFMVTLGIGWGCFLAMNRPGVMGSVARLPVADERIIHRGWITFGQLGFGLIWSAWCLLFVGLTWLTDDLGAAWPWLMIDALGAAGLMLGVSGVAGLVLPRRDFQQAVAWSMLLPLFGMIGGITVARLAEGVPFVSAVAVSLNELLPTTWMTNAVVRRPLTGATEWGSILGGLGFGTLAYLAIRPLFGVLHAIKSVGREAKSTTPSSERREGMDDWCLSGEHEAFWQRMLFIERVAKSVLTKREELAFEAVSGGRIKITFYWFWTLLAVIGCGFVSSLLMPLLNWAVVPLIASVLIVMTYFLLPVGMVVSDFQRRMIKENPFPLLPVDGGEVLRAGIKVYLVRALFGAVHVFAFLFGMPQPEHVAAIPLGMLLLFGGMIWSLYTGVSLLLSIGPLVWQLDAFSLFRLRGWLVWGVMSLVFFGPIGSVALWVPESEALFLWIAGAFLFSVSMYLLMGYGMWRFGKHDYKGGLLMQRGIFAPPQRELLERLIYRS